MLKTTVCLFRTITLGKTIVGCNNWRVAAVWLEELVEMCSQLTGSSYNSSTCGEISQRQALKQELQCKDFQWFLFNVYPELQLPGPGDKSFG